MERTSPIVRAAQYVRMSTEHQRYSIEHQLIANADYAARRGFQIVRTYSDAGVSGLRLDRRVALKRLLADALGGEADFAAILTYDVSRWGRFQDPDQSAHYEFICREAGVALHYCAELFENDGSLASSLVKQLKRAMAAEYSRELSDKVSGAHRGLGAKGFWQGGPAGLGMRRVSLNRDGSQRELLEAGERNGIAGNRVILVPGPAEEVALVRAMFRDFLSGLSTNEIARRLNDSGCASARGSGWVGSTVRRILQCEKYAGVQVVGRMRCRLGARTKEPQDRWVRVETAFEPIVSKGLFAAVQRQFNTRRPYRSDEAMLEAVRGVLADRGRLNFHIISDDPRTHSATSYVRRFGSLSAVYDLVGYTPSERQRRAVENIRKHRPDRHRTFPPPN